MQLKFKHHRYIEFLIKNNFVIYKTVLSLRKLRRQKDMIMNCDKIVIFDKLKDFLRHGQATQENSCHALYNNWTDVEYSS